MSVGDHTVRIWDTGTPGQVQVIAGHGGEVLTCDWSKYDQARWIIIHIHRAVVE